MGCSRKACGIFSAILLFLAFVVLALLLVFVFKDNIKNPIQARTKNAGIILGKTVTLKDDVTEMHEFHNIRYAVAPIGELRFRPPVRPVVDPEQGVEASDETPVVCVQADTGVGVEDCLVLSVRSRDLTASKPVLVWIHGGGLATGYGMMQGYSFDAEVTHKVDAVTVNINFRLGFIGFSSVEELWDEEAGVYANNGIRDMIAALDWIQDNIAAFGGDPGSVTLIGESGGATAVLALVSSPLANNKFHAAIAQSPAPEMRFTHEQGNDFQRELLDRAGCTQEDLAGRKQCLLDIPANKFSGKGGVNMTSGGAYFEFPMSGGERGEYVGLIMVDPTVVTVSPRTLKEADFTPTSPISIIVSNTAAETYNVWLWPFVPPFNTEDQLKAKLEPLIEEISDVENVMDTVIALYPDQDPTMIWTHMTTDMRATCPSNDVAEGMSAATNRDIYRLYVSHSPSFALAPFHAYDSYAFFGYKSDSIEPPTITNMDIKFQSHYIEMVKRFSRDKKFDDKWTTYPGATMMYENSDTISNAGAAKPQEAVCEKLAELDLVKYGSQNK